MGLYKSLSTMNYAGDGISFLNMRFEKDVILNIKTAGRFILPAVFIIYD